MAYAEKRLKQHLNRFYKLFNDLEEDSIDEGWLKEIEARDNIFWNMNCVKYYLETQNSAQPTLQRLKLSSKEIPIREINDERYR